MPVLRWRGGPAATQWILFVHSGGFTAGRPQDFDAHARWLAEETGADVVAPAYRLAPAHPYPAAVDDCVAVAVAQSRAAGETPRAIVGISAGGTIAASAAVELGPACTRLLVLESPLLDDAPDTSSHRCADDPRWGRADHLLAWSAYLPPGAPERARPGRVTSGIPPVYVSVGGRELALDEIRQWTDRLLASGTPCTLRVWPGMAHGFETKEPAHPVSREARAHQLDAILRS